MQQLGNRTIIMFFAHIKTLSDQDIGLYEIEQEFAAKLEQFIPLLFKSTFRTHAERRGLDSAWIQTRNLLLLFLC